MMALVMIMRKRRRRMRRRMRRGMRRITVGVSKKGNEGEETESSGKKP